MPSSYAEKVEKLRALHSRRAAAFAAATLAVGDRAADGAIYAGVSPDTKLPMYAAPADEPALMDFGAAAARAATLSQETGQAYRVPTKSELTMLFNARAKIRDFCESVNDDAGWYRSSTPYPSGKDHSGILCFGDGDWTNSLKTRAVSIRLVRD